MTTACSTESLSTSCSNGAATATIRPNTLSASVDSWRVQPRAQAGGWFYLTTKNRYGWNYLLGKPDEHTFGWRFGQALPRWLIATLMKWRGKPRISG